MADELSCSICLFRYSEAEHIPLLLKCGHTFCKDCLSLAKTQARTQCPTCSIPDAFDVVDRLPKNYLVLEMVIRGVLTRQSSLGMDPWSCSIHHSEPLTYFSKRSGKFYCSECYKTSDHADLVFVDRAQIKEQLHGFRELYEQSNPFDMQYRSKIVSKLGVALDGHKFTALEQLTTLYQSKRAQIELQHEMRVAELTHFFTTQLEAFSCAKSLISIFKESKRLKIPFESLYQSLSFDKQQDLLMALIGYEERETIDASKVLAMQLDVGFDFTVPPKQLELTEKVVDLSLKVMKDSGASSSDVDEYVAHRFEKPNTRWGIFDNRNQVEAVSFSVSRTVFLVGVGIGSSFQKGKSVMCEDLQILGGINTRGDMLAKVERVEMKNEDGATKVVRINFQFPVKLNANADYTLRAVLKGEAGVFRGTTVSKTVTVNPPGITISFKGANYHQDDIKNGDNLEDGPIFDFYFSIGKRSEETRIQRFSSISGNWGFFNPAQVESFAFQVNQSALLSGVGLSTSINDTVPLVMLSLQVLEGKSTQGPIVLYQSPAAVNIEPSPSKAFQVPLTPPLDLKANAFYTLKIIMSGTAGAYRGQGFKGPVIEENGLTVTFESALYEGPDRKDGDNASDGPITDLYLIPKAAVRNFGKH